MLYKFKVKKLLNLLRINNLNLNNLILSSSSDISTIVATKAPSIKGSEVIRRLLIKRAVAIRVSLRKSSAIAAPTAINIFSAKFSAINTFFAKFSSSYRP